jgi:Predicted membrane protein
MFSNVTLMFEGYNKTIKRKNEFVTGKEAGMDSLKSFFGTPKKAFLFIVCVLAVLSAFVIGTTFAVTAIVNSSLNKEGAKDGGNTVFYEEKISETEGDTTVIEEEGSIAEDDTTVMIPDGIDSNAADQPGMASPDMEVEEAKAIAAGHAGFSVSDVSFSKAKLEKEHRLMVYEIEFYKDGMEYEYEINAETGEIIKYEVDEND